MEFGVFDHVDRGVEPLAEFYENRLKLAEAYDRHGFYCYHIAEHHFTPLGMAASPSIFLSAVAQRTVRLKLGALVYTLPLHHPLRVAEEICMLDQMSRGRLQIGVGRGISPIESAYYGEATDVETSRKVYDECLAILLAALQEKRVHFEGKYRRAADVPMELTPYQKPTPPLWMGVTTLANAETAARQGFNFVSRAEANTMRTLVDRYWQVFSAQHQGRALDQKLGLSAYIVVAETDAKAQAIAGRAYRRWHESHSYLYRLHGRPPVFGERSADFQGVVRDGWGIAGSPDTVFRYLSPILATSGVNYLVGQHVFGDMTLDEATHSIDLYAKYVMPQLREEHHARAA